MLCTALMSCGRTVFPSPQHIGRRTSTACDAVDGHRHFLSPVLSKFFTPSRHKCKFLLMLWKSDMRADTRSRHPNCKRKVCKANSKNRISLRPTCYVWHMLQETQNLWSRKAEFWIRQLRTSAIYMHRDNSRFTWIELASASFYEVLAKTTF